MKKLIILPLVGCLTLATFGVQAQVKTWPLLNLFFKNQFDKNGSHHGRWVFTTEAVGESERMVTKGRYRHGLPVGTWKTLDGKRTVRKREESKIINGLSVTEGTEFYADGTIKKKGATVLDRTGPTPRYYMKDEWSYYLENGQLDKKIFYEEGWCVKTTYPDGKEVLTPAPPKHFPAAPGTPQNPANARKGIKMIRKANEIITIHYKENGDSTVQVTTVKPVQ